MRLVGVYRKGRIEIFYRGTMQRFEVRPDQYRHVLRPFDYVSFSNNGSGIAVNIKPV